MSKLNLEEFLGMHTVNELKSMLTGFSMKLKSGLRKAEIVKAFSHGILIRPEWVISCLTTYELRWYDRIINHPDEFDYLPKWLDLPFTFYSLLPEGKRTAYGSAEELYVVPDLAERMGPLLAEAIAERESNGEERLESEIIGLLNLCGIYDWKKIVDRILTSSDDEEVQNCLFSRIRRRQGYSDDFGVIFDSPLSDWVYRGVDHIEIDGQEPPEFDADELVAAAAFPVPQVGGEYRDKLRRALMAHGHSGIEADELIMSVWRSKQRDEITSSLLPEGVKLRADEFMEVFPLITDYLNNVPFWKFRGWSSAQMARKNPPALPRSLDEIAIGPNMRARGVTSWEQLGISSIDDLHRIAGDSPFAGMQEVSGKKPGRNDPCPCGSGKKYKHCCGR